MRGCFVPSFAEDVQTELKLAAESLVLSKIMTKPDQLNLTPACAQLFVYGSFFDIKVNSVLNLRAIYLSSYFCSSLFHIPVFTPDMLPHQAVLESLLDLKHLKLVLDRAMKHPKLRGVTTTAKKLVLCTEQVTASDMRRIFA